MRELDRLAEEALACMRKASEEGTGCHLTADMIRGLATTTVSEMWETPPPGFVPRSVGDE